jgi:hypothetical protein
MLTVLSHGVLQVVATPQPMLVVAIHTTCNNTTVPVKRHTVLLPDM